VSDLPRLDRSSPQAPPAPPVRIVHLGLGNFHRAHQAWYTHRAPDADKWGIAAFTGRRPDMAQALAPQGGLYTLITRSGDDQHLELVSSIAAAHAADEHDAFLDYLRRPEVAIVTITLTEQAYLRSADGHLDTNRHDVAADVTTLSNDSSAPAGTLPGRLLAGILARRAAGAGELTILSCDNLPDNGAVTRTIVTDLATVLAPEAVDWINENVDFATSMVDRITPATTDADRDLIAAERGYTDAVPVPTEPFSEWVIAGRFPAGRPAWQEAGVQFVDDVAAHERRKLWLLNGSHSLLAYVAPLFGHRTIDEAVADPFCQDLVEQFWDEAQAHLGLPAADVRTYRQDLLDRYSNTGVRHQLAQIAHDGSQKLPVRTLPVIRAHRAEGSVPRGAAATVAGWILHLRGQGAPVNDAGAEAAQRAAAVSDPAAAVAGVLQTLEPGPSGLADDEQFVAAVVDRIEQFSAQGASSAAAT